MNSTLKKYLLLAGIAGAIVALDQFTKSLVRNSLAVGETWMPWEWLAPFARVIHWQNDGVVFGLFQGVGDMFAVLTALVVVAIVYFYPRIPESEKPLRIALAMQAGGAIGNLVDRVTIGHVTDFVSLGNFPVFNMADSSITLGVVVLLIGLYFDERRRMNEEKKAAQAEQAEKETAEPAEQPHE